MANLKRSTKMAAKAPAKKAPAKKEAPRQSLIQMLKGRKGRLDKAIDG